MKTGTRPRRCCSLALFLIVALGVLRAVAAELPPDVRSVQASLTGFALDLYLQTTSDTGNFCFSPLSVSMAVGAAYTGARGNTQAEMAKAMHSDLDPVQYHQAFGVLRARSNESMKNSRIRLRVAKGLFADSRCTLNEAFLGALRTDFGYEVCPTDFTAPAASISAMLNGWVSEKTNHKITQLISPAAISPTTRVVVLNAIYFKGLWEERFAPLYTEPADFWLAKDSRVSVPLMYQRVQVRYAETPSLQVVALPYTGGHIEIVLLLPRAVDGLSQLQQDLNAESLARWLDMLSPRGRYDVKLFLPRFSFDSALELSALLTAMGMSDLFSPSRADLTGITGTRELFMGPMPHKAGIEVNEEGTEAWAATGGEFIEMGAQPSPPPLRIFRADHPFIFLITTTEMRTILFMGRVTKPSILTTN